MNTGDGIQLGVGIVLAVTMVGVWWYAWEARKQAKASASMAEEVREQRLGEDRPQLWINVKDLTPDGGKRRFAKGETIHDCYPTNLTLEVQNVGRGPAKDVVATAVHPRKEFLHQRVGYMLQGVAPWEFGLSLDPLGGFHAAHGGLSPRRLGDWLADRGVSPESPVGSPFGVVVEYRDIHERHWVSYLELDYESETGDEEDELIWWIEPGRQSTVGPLAPKTPPAKGAAL